MMNVFNTGFHPFVTVFVRTVLYIAALSVNNATAAEFKVTDVPPAILYVGDSHSVGSFGIQENALLRRLKGFQVATYAICGSSPQWWMQGGKTNCGYFFSDTGGHEQRGWEAETPLLAKLLKEHQPRYTVVELGANMYGMPADMIEQTANEMALAIVSSGSKCIWIGPPHARIQPEPGLSVLFDALQRGVGQYCLLFDSRKFTTYPDSGGDGIHFDSLGESGQIAAGNWALSAYYAFNPLLKIGKPVK